MTFRLSDIDLRQLRVFQAVVECRGFTSAQSVLNVGQSTISSQMAQLETRLGVRLCERGRTGFELTDKGRSVYEEVTKLFRAHEEFQNATSELKGRLNGTLGIALIDNVITDPNCPIVRAFNLFNKRDHGVSIKLEILSPVEMEQALLDKDVDIAIGTFHHQVPGLQYKFIYREVNDLLCGPDHPIFSMQDDDEIREAMKDSRKITRTYLDLTDLSPLGEFEESGMALIRNLEALAILILSGGHIGFLPRHYAATWVLQNRMRPILPNEIEYTSEFSIVMRNSPRSSLIIRKFLNDLDTAVKESCYAN